MKTNLLFLLCFSGSNLLAQTDITHAENIQTLGLSGKVKRVVETSYHAKKGNAGLTKTSKGWQYDFETDSESIIDTLGNLVLEYQLLPSKKEITYSIQYDSLKRIVAVNRLQSTQQFVYDSLNRICSSTKENRNSRDLQPPVQFHYTYDSQGRLSKIETFGGANGVFIETYQYGPSGNLVYSELKAGDFIETHQYKYNEDLMLIKEEWKDSKAGMLETHSYTYKDKQKFLDHWVEYENGLPNGSIDDTYANGNTIKSVEKDPDGVIVVLETCTYQSDKQGNWIKKTITENDHYYIVERVIEYY